MEKVDIAIIGAGVVGMAVALELSYRSAGSIAVVERNHRYGQETSSRNSEVIHSGIYYAPDMLKSQLCVKGNKLLYDFCADKKVDYLRCGKMVIATSEPEREQIEKLFSNARMNGVEARLLTGSEVSGMEPEIQAKCGLLVPSSGTINSGEMLAALYYHSCNQGVVYLFGYPVIAVESTGNGYEIKTPVESIKADVVINCAGLGASELAGMAGLDIDACNYKIHLCKGEYFKMRNRFDVKRLIYPLPDMESLGIHLTRDRSGSVRLGPNAIYVNEIDYSIDESHQEDFYQAAKKYLPELKLEDLSPDFAGIRPKLQAPGETPRDFVIQHEVDRGLPGWINLIGIESPGLTSSMAIAEYVASLIK